jgi:3-hydroxyisobutyrate dehydrogenase
MTETASAQPRVAVLGTGVMGTGMTRSLLREGFPVTAWNRTREKAEPLADDGAKVADDPAEAVGDADVVVTMLFDVDAVLEVASSFESTLRDDAVWVQSSTVGVGGTRRIAEHATEHGLALVDAPVLGTRKPAEEGALVVLAAGDPANRDRVAPVFDAIGSRTLWVADEPGPASALKLACNTWIATVTAGVAQSLAMTKAFGLDPQLFLDAIDGGPMDLPYAHLKGEMMMTDDFPVAFALDGLLKDLGLAVDAAAEAGLDPRVARAMHETFAEASQAGDGGEDIAAVHRLLRG